MNRTISHLVGPARLLTFTDLWQKATGIPLSVIDPDGSVLAHSGQQDICGHFCRLDPGTEKTCSRNDRRVALKVGAGRKYAVEKCSHGVVHASTPITVLGAPVGRFVAGPFFFAPPDMGLFARHAAESGFDESACRAMVSHVPIVGKAKMDAFLQWFSVLSEILLDAGAAAASAGDLEENVLSNMKGLVLPYVERLKKSGLSAEQVNAVDILETNLKEITSPFIGKLHTLGLTPGEIAVASLLKEGKTTKQIAALLDVSARAVESTG